MSLTRVSVSKCCCKECDFPFVWSPKEVLGVCLICKGTFHTISKKRDEKKCLKKATAAVFDHLSDMIDD